MSTRRETVAVISGGRSSEHEISIMSGAAVAAGLREAGFGVVEVVIARDGVWSSGGRPVTLEPAAGLLGADVAFPVLHGPFGEDGTVQGLLEVLDIPYVGSGVLASALCMDKLTLKRLFAFHGVAQVDFVAVGEEGWRERLEEFGLPVWVKPSRLGSSVGIRPVDSLGPELDAAVAEAAAHDPRVIVEAPARGAEVECSVLGDLEGDGDGGAAAANSGAAGEWAIGPLTVSPPGRIAIEAEWYDFEAKYSEGAMELRIPAEIPAAAVAEVRRLSARAFELAGCSGLARCDFFVEDDGRVLLSEINTMPGFTPTSVYSRLLESAGIPYPALCTTLIDLALTRHTHQSTLRH